MPAIRRDGRRRATRAGRGAAAADTIASAAAAAIEKYSGTYSDVAGSVLRVREKDVDDEPGEVEQDEQLDPELMIRSQAAAPAGYGRP